MGNYKNKQEFELRLLNFQEFIKNGYNIRKSAKLANISYDCARRTVKKLNIEVKNKGNSNLTNHDYFETINTERKAYLLGFFLADGCIQSNSNAMSLSNSVDDLEILKIFKEEICQDNTLRITKMELTKDICCIKWSSSKMIRDLKNWHIEPRKTFDFNFKFPFEKLPKEMIRHFIRGFFDGDGHIHNKGDHIEFIMTSKDFAKQIINIFEERFDCTFRLREKQSKNVIEYMPSLLAKNRYLLIPKIYNWFYKDSTIFLTRKKIKFENYLNTVVNKRNKELLSP